MEDTFLTQRYSLHSKTLSKTPQGQAAHSSLSQLN
jgi:hypothetical protein